MVELNQMMREHALAGLNTQLDAAVTNGDTAKAREISGQIAQLTLQTAPKAPPYGDTEIKAALEAKADWFGVDPRKSAAAVRLGKDMNPRKFATAEAFAEALLKAVDEEFKPASSTTTAEGDADPAGDNNDADPPKDKDPGGKPRRTDGPKDGEMGTGRASAARSGPWTKLSDAPSATQAEIKRQADKFVPAGAPKEQREAFISRALEGHYAEHVRKGKK